MSDNWTWRQYAVFRALFGAYLLVHFAMLLPFGAELFSSAGMVPDAAQSPLTNVFPNLLHFVDTPIAISVLLVSCCVASVLLAFGRFDRSASVWLWFLLACLFGRNPLIANPSLPVIGWLLLMNALLPPRREPWEDHDVGSPALPQEFTAAVWVMLAVAYSFSGWTKLSSDAWVAGETVRYVLENPLARDTWLREALLATPPRLLEAVTHGILWVELLFAPLALLRVLRPWLWLSMLLVQLGFLTLLNFADLTVPMLLLHLLTFDPRWLPGTAQAGEQLYYDGRCGVCHAWVRFLLAEDRPAKYRFVPMQGATAAHDLPEIAAADEYGSMLVRTADGRLLSKLAAVRHLLAGVGGLWRLAAWLLALVPTALGDLCYDFLARRRHVLRPAPAELCPLLPGNLALRFDD